MKHLISLLILITTQTIISQVAIGTTTPDDGSALQIESTTGALVPPRVTTSQMNNIPTPLDGAIVFNTTKNNLYIKANNIWTPLVMGNKGTLVVNRDYGNSNNNAISTTNNSFSDFPIGIPHIVSNDTSLYNVTGNGTVNIIESGNYLFSASFSTRDAPAGNSKFIISVEINNALVGYLSRGFTSLPSQDFWGTSGSLMLPVTAGQKVKFRYVFNNNGNPLDARFFNFGINKLD